MSLKDTSPLLQTCLLSINHLLVGRCSKVRATADFLPFLSEHKRQFNGTKPFKLMVDFSSGPSGSCSGSLWDPLGSLLHDTSVSHSPNLSSEAGNRQKLMQNHILSCQCKSWSYTGTHSHTRVRIYALVPPQPLLLPVKIKILVD